jgi:hypothetical protein
MRRIGRLLASATRLWFVEPGLLAEDFKCSRVSSWWALGATMTRVRMGCGRRLSRERSGGCGRPIGEEIGYRSRHYTSFFNTARSDGIEFRKEGGAGRSSRNRGPQGSAVLEGDVDKSRPLRRKRAGVTAAATSVKKFTDPTSPGGE